MQLWEYRVYEHDLGGWGTKNNQKIEEDLNRAGKEGWEVVSAIPMIAVGATTQPVTKHIVLILKRPKG